MFYWPNKCLLSLLLKSSSYSIIQTFIHFYIPLTHHLSVRVYSRNIPGCCPIPYNLSMTARKHARKTEGNLISSFLVSMQYSRSDSSLELANRTLQCGCVREFPKNELNYFRNFVPNHHQSNAKPTPLTSVGMRQNPICIYEILPSCML